MTDPRACQLDHLPDFYCTKCHLPECRAKGLGLWDGIGLCICDELRAAEERVLRSARDAVDRTGGRAWISKPETLAAIDALRAAP